MDKNNTLQNLQWAIIRENLNRMVNKDTLQNKNPQNLKVGDNERNFTHSSHIKIKSNLTVEKDTLQK